MKRAKTDHEAISTQGLLDVVLFFSVFWMIYFGNRCNHNKNKNRDSSVPTSRGKWSPNVVYLPVLLLRFIFVPQRSGDNTQYYKDDLKHHPFNHHDGYDFPLRGQRHHNSNHHNHNHHHDSKNNSLLSPCHDLSDHLNEEESKKISVLMDEL